MSSTAQDLDLERHRGSCFALLVKTDLQAEPRHKGMSMLLAEKGKVSPSAASSRNSATRASIPRSF